MAVVGPRPLLVKYLPLYNEHQARRHEVRPGFTGYAQVNGRNAITWDDKFEKDVFYVDHITFLGDWKIIFQTLKTVIRREGISSGSSVPVYNAEKHLEDAIKSVLEQTYSEFELIAVNDGSTDRSLEILQQFTDQRVRIINKENTGVSDARNAAIKAAKGEFTFTVATICSLVFQKFVVISWGDFFFKAVSVSICALILTIVLYCKDPSFRVIMSMTTGLLKRV